MSKQVSRSEYRHIRDRANAFLRGKSTVLPHRHKARKKGKK